MAPKHKSGDVGNSDIPKRSYQVLPLNEKVNILDLIKKGEKKNLKLSLLRPKVRMNLILWNCEEGKRDEC